MINETASVDKWGYLTGICMLSIIWIWFYCMRRDLRSRILTMSAVLLPLAPFGQYFFLKDYWHPPVILPIELFGSPFGGLADLLFAFVMGGIATSAFLVIFRKEAIAGKAKTGKWIFFAFLGIEGVSVVVLSRGLHMNSIFSSSIGFVITAIVIGSVRPDLILSMLVSGLVSGLALAGAEGILSFIVPFYLSRYWYLYHTNFGLLILGRVPATELMWGVAFGLVIGPIFDFYKGLVFIPKSQRIKIRGIENDLKEKKGYA